MHRNCKNEIGNRYAAVRVSEYTAQSPQLLSRKNVQYLNAVISMNGCTLVLTDFCLNG